MSAGGGGNDDPVGKVRAAGKVSLPKRFYTKAGVEPAAAGDGFIVVLDGRPVNTPRRKPLVVPVRSLATALAGEWEAQVDQIDPAKMPLTRLVNSALDGVRGQEAAVRADIVKYAGSDLLCYRATHPEALVARQVEQWDPVLTWVDATFGARFALATGIMHIVQPKDALASVERAVEPLDALRLAALHSITTLTGSALLGLACEQSYLECEDAWRLAHLDEDYQAEQWGQDAEAARQRAHRLCDMQAAYRLLAFMRDA